MVLDGRGVTGSSGPGFVLDTGALIALEKPSRAKKLSLLFDRIGPAGRLAISAGSIAEAWRASPRQTPLVFLMRRQDVCIEEITVPVAKSIGAFLAHVNNGDDIVDAHVIMLARHFRLPVITTDPDDLRALDPKVPLVEL
jgi:predicted nucleic acid-binding protein